MRSASFRLPDEIQACAAYVAFWWLMLVFLAKSCLLLESLLILSHVTTIAGVRSKILNNVLHRFS